MLLRNVYEPGDRAFFRGGAMRAPVTSSVYLSAVLAVIGAVLASLWLFAPNASQPGDWKAATGQKTQTAPVDGSAFRYGPEINHGRSDTPVNAREQALREAQGIAAYPGEYRPAYQGRSARRSGTTTFFNRGLQSGH
jgi:hypothetical protein